MRSKYLKPDNFFEDRRYFNIAEAIYYGNGSLLEEYLEMYKDLDINKLGNRGATFLLYAIYLKDLKMMRILLEHGADPNVKSYFVPYKEPVKEDSDRLCIYPLGKVVEYYEDYNKKYIELLLEYGADINDNTCYEPPFIHAVHSSVYSLEDKKALMEFLLKKGANINVQNKYGQTALISCFGGSFPYDTLEWLLDHGADYKITDRWNVSVVHKIQRYLDKSPDEQLQRIKKRLESEGVLFPKGTFFPVKEGERLPDIEYRK